MPRAAVLTMESLKVLLLLCALLSFSFGQKYCLVETVLPSKNTGKTLKINKANWKASELDAEILGILLREKLGYTIEFAKAEEIYQISALASGEADIVCECWPSAITLDYRKYVSNEKIVEDVGALGIVGQNGWYVPTFTLSNGEYDVFSTFKDAKKALYFAKDPMNATKGFMYSGSLDWANYDRMLVDNLGLQLELYNLSGEEEMMNVVTDALANNKPILIYCWTPHPQFSKHRGKLTRVMLPFSPVPCQTEDRISKGTVNCDYPAEIVIKLARADLKTRAPDAYNVLRRFVLTNQAQIDMTSAVTFDGAAEYDTACNWLKNNTAVWSTWFEGVETISAPIDPVPIALPIAVVVPLLIFVIVTVVCTVICYNKAKRKYFGE